MNQHTNENAANGAIYGWRYRLRAATPLNAGAGAPMEIVGFLLRNDDGFGCVQPWPQFGHGTVDEAWQALERGGGTELTQQALQCCRIDGAARRAGVSLWDDCHVPDSHATLTNAEQARAAYDAGFRVWKIKCGPNDLATVTRLFEAFPEVKFRLDCNETASPEILLLWAREHASALEFIEDPFPHDRHDDWQKLSEIVPVAMDRIWQPRATWTPVWKPAWNEMPTTMQGEKTLVTSAMDHPVGQAWAAWNAAQIGTTMTCGLRTEHLFETNDFSKQMFPWQARWPKIAGTGFGWDQLLDNLSWIKIR